MFPVCSVLSLALKTACPWQKVEDILNVSPVLETFTTATHKLGEIFNSQGQMTLQPVEKAIP